MESVDLNPSAMVTLQMSIEDYLKWRDGPSIEQASHPPKRYVYGLKGIQELLGCSTTTAWRIKNKPWMRPAIMQVGRKIVIDVEEALKLIKENMYEIS